MIAEETQAVMEALNGGAQNALFVGGCVRNELMGEEVGDIDIATKLSPDEVQAVLNKVGIKTVPTGIAHGTVTAVINKKHFEITTLRKDVETDGRRAVVAFTDDWAEDAQRRDFTMNTMLADAQGNIFDPTGLGLKDIETRKVVFVGEPAERIAEDYLRALRFFRFHAWYGKGEPDKKALAACKAAAGKIETLSRERITQEFFKILSVKEPEKILDLMFAHNILQELSKNYDPVLMKHVCHFQERYGLVFTASRLFVLAGLQSFDFEKYLLIPKVFLKDIEAIDAVLHLPALDQEQAVKVAVYKYGRVPTAQALIIELAQDRVMNGYAPEALKIIQKWNVPVFPVGGDELMKQGFSGPALGQRLRELEENWIQSGFKL